MTAISTPTTTPMPSPKLTIPVPEWLTQRGGTLVHNAVAYSVSVFFAGQLQYVLIAVPAKGKHACRISETINGRRVESATTYDSAEAALAGGLNDLRAVLGW